MTYRWFSEFVRNEAGAVTVDFVVLTSAVVGLGLSVLLVIAPGLNPAAAKVDPVLDAAPGLGASLIASK